jgi:D-sedoheptulose 7-phosphate isomerase
MFLQRFKELQKVVENCEYSTKKTIIPESKAIRLFHSLLLNVKNDQGIAYLIGNGGSAGIASHFAVDFLNACKIPSSTLYDSNVLTCLSNDYGYENVFSRQLEILMTEKDLLVAISSSGKSSNIIKAVNVAQKKNCQIITLSGFSSKNPLKELGDLNFWLGVSDYGLVETGHFFLLHTVVDDWKTNFFSINELKGNRLVTKNN